MKIKILRPSALFLLLLLLPSISFGWGSKGHEAIVKLAFKLMPKEQKARIIEIVGMRDASDIGNWADQVKDRKTSHWHFVDIPRDATSYDASRDCKKGCLVSEIEELEVALKSKDLPDEDRREDLLYLIHLLGDLYQPFHCLEDYSGASRLMVTFHGQPWSLHHVWDFGMFEDHLLDASASRALLKRAKSLQASPLEMDVGKIAMMERNIAVANLEKPDALLTEEYSAQHWDIVEIGLASAASQIAQRTKNL